MMTRAHHVAKIADRNIDTHTGRRSRGLENISLERQTRKRQS